MADKEKQRRVQRQDEETQTLLPMLIAGLALITIGMIGVVIFV